jgi:hypothetical protein
VCADRAVLLGHKPSFVGGPAEANALRMLLGRQLGLQFPYPSGGEAPDRPVRALVIDRDAVDRPFANARGVLDVLRGYGVPTTYVRGSEYAALSFAQQARLFNGHTLLVAAHGAALSNAVFLPPRSAVIEVYPRGAWKPTYARIVTALGHVHLPVFSFAQGGPRHANAPYVPTVDAAECHARSYPRVTRDNCFPWLRAMPVAVPLHAFEHAVVAALNVVGYARVEPRGVAGGGGGGGGADGGGMGGGSAKRKRARRRPRN